MKPPPTRRAVKSAGLGVHARVGTPKTAGYGGSHWPVRFWGALAGTTAGAIIPGPAGVSEWKRLAGDLWGRAGEGGLEISKLAFLSGSKPPSRTSRRPPGWAQAVLRSDCTARTAASETSASKGEATRGSPRQLP